MNKRIDFTILGGLPYVQETFDWMQDSYRNAFTSFAKMLGDKVIVNGCQVIGGNVTDGWITYNGELVRFIGSAYAAGNNVIVVDGTASPLNPATYGDNTPHTIYYEKIARIGGPGGFPFTDLKPPNLGVPVGTVLMWSGNVAAIPAGFALCDGTNGTPNLKGMFIAGYDAADVDYNAIGKTGGAKKTTLDWANLPAQASGPVNSGEYGMIQRSVPGAINTIQSADSNGSGTEPNLISPPQKLDLGGAGIAIDRRAPYYTLAYIIKQ